MTFTIREITKDDITPEFFETLSNLKPKNLDRDLEKAKKIFAEMADNPIYNTFVAVDDGTGEVIGTTSVLIEQKFINNFGKCAHLEDVAVRKGFQEKGIGKTLVQKAIEFAKENKCYKMILTCAKHNIEFYKKLGFRKYKEQSMIMRWDE
ncbi:GNAT family N-acetyltransferase [Candidatus Woesearchaeota archaeon]|nr:GNAT family N-acetyltransferase [Candidatus Woesearchaeota archaeon]